MTRLEAVTCLGCGCACDDLAVVHDAGRIARVEGACALGLAWFGDGTVPAAALAAGAATDAASALAQAAALLRPQAGRVLVVLAPDVSTEAIRWAIHAADALRATIDTATSPTAAHGILAAQRRGRAGATLGEMRNRADVLVCWGVDPAALYPRFAERYLPLPAGLHVPEGRAGRTVVSVAIGEDAGPADADLHLTLPPELEVEALACMRSAVQGRALPPLDAPLRAAVDLAQRLATARYAVVVHDAEPQCPGRDPARAEGLIALLQALNTPARAALCSLRAGGNRNGIEAALTWQTGFPFAVDFAEGAPTYRPMRRGLADAATGRFGAALVVGSWRALDDGARQALATLPTACIGPHASEAPFAPRVAIDTGVAGVHEGGTGYRLDDVPLPLRPALSHPHQAAALMASLCCLLAEEHAP